MPKSISYFLISLSILMLCLTAEAANTNVATVSAFNSAYGSAAAGDTITITAGLTFTSAVNFSRSGSVGNPIVIRGSTVARVRCTSSVTATNGAYQIGGSNMVFQNILFVDKGQPFNGNSTQYNNPYPAPASGTSYPWGLFSNEYVSMWFSGNRSTGVIFKNCEWRGAFYRLVDATEVNFEMYNCVIDNIQNREALFGHLVDCRRCNNIKFVNCKFKWNTAYRHYAFSNKAGNMPGSSFGKGFLVEGCYWYFPVPEGEEWVDPPLCLGPFEEGNVYGSNEFNKDFVIRYNLFVNCSYTPISVEECSNADIYNNTFINCGISPNWQPEEAKGAGVGWPLIGIIRILDHIPETGYITVGEGEDGRVRYLSICNNIFWSNHPANEHDGHIYLVDGYGNTTAGTAKNADVPGLNVAGNVVWHTANATTPNTVIEGVNCHGNDSWCTPLNIPLQNTSRKDPQFVNATGDTDGNYRPQASDLPAPVSFTKQSAWQPQITGLDPQGGVINANYVGAVNPSGATSLKGSSITPLNDNMPSIAVMPNPYSGVSGHIYFTLPRAADITVALFDLNGRLVKMLERGTFEAGRWASPIRYQELAAGQYIVRLWSSDGFSASQKMLIRK